MKQTQVCHDFPGISSSRFSCCTCRKPLANEELLAFGGTFACEGCVRDYYQSHEPEVAEDEVELRRRQGRSLLRRLRSRAPRGGDL